MKYTKSYLILITLMVLTFEVSAMKKRAGDGNIDTGDGKKAKRAKVEKEPKVDVPKDKEPKKTGYADLKQLTLVQEVLESMIETYRTLGAVSKIKIGLIPKKALDKHTKIFFEIDVAAKIKASESSALAKALDSSRHKAISALIVEGISHFLDVCSSPLDAFKSFSFRIESQPGTGDTFSSTLDFNPE